MLQDRVKNTVIGEPKLILEEVETVQRQESAFLVSEASQRAQNTKCGEQTRSSAKRHIFRMLGTDEDCGEYQHPLAELQKPLALHTIDRGLKGWKILV